MSGRRGTNKTFTLITSDIVDISTAIDLDNIDASKPHCFVGAQFYSDAQGAAVATPTAGTVSIEVETINTSPVLEPIPDPTIEASAPCTRSWAANTRRVVATPSGIDVATYYSIKVTCNET